jgi:hypothetical protein
VSVRWTAQDGGEGLENPSEDLRFLVFQVRVHRDVDHVPAERLTPAVTFQMAEVTVPRVLFVAILGRIGRLRAVPNSGLAFAVDGWGVT